MNSARSGIQPRQTRALLIVASCYLLFVVYGSLVPLDFQPRPIADAWRAFLSTSYLQLGVESRADWVANILLYIPLAFLLSACLAGTCKAAAGCPMRLGLVAAICFLIALGIEFAQLYFPPRTVSVNDILAEGIGTVLGIIIWVVWGARLSRLWKEMARGGLPAIRALVSVYVLAYLALSLFPYDFLVTASEYADKIAAGGYGWLFAAGTCDRYTSCLGKVLLDFVAVVPLGILLAMAIGRDASRPYFIAAVLGLALSVMIEVAQFSLASGRSEGVSLLTRPAGVLFGAFVSRNVGAYRWAHLPAVVGPALMGLTPVYLVALAWASGLFSAKWVGVEQARAGLPEVRWLPFYYHYFTTETQALQSLLACTAMYLPVGFGYWALTMRRAATAQHASAWVPAFLAAAIAMAMEMGKLFVPGKHPDPTNVLIAAAASAAGYVISTLSYRWAAHGEQTVPGIDSTSTESSELTLSASSLGAMRTLLSLLLLGGVGIALWNYPLNRAWMASALAAYAVAIWQVPRLVLPAMLALLPWLDLAPWTGWVLLNEFDVFIVVAIALHLLREPLRSVRIHLSRAGVWAIALILLSFIASTVVGVLPLAPLDWNAVANYYTGYSALRQFKGFAWALVLFYWLLNERWHARCDAQALVSGLLVGLAGVIAVVVWERLVFAGLADFAGEYRVEGSFPELHTGGGDIHAYLAMAIPFVVVWTVVRPGPVRYGLGVVMFALASYALAVTFTRGAYVGYLAAMGVGVIAAAVLWWHHRRTAGIGPLVLVSACVSVVLVVIVPVLTGAFMQSRLASARSEASVRIQHWDQAIGIMDTDPRTMILGMGLGSFPRTLLMRDPEQASATLSYVHEDANTFLRLGSGKPLYLGQRVEILPGRDYRLSLDMRSTDPKAAVGISLCEKSLQQSFRCIGTKLEADGSGDSWQHRTVTLSSGAIGSGSWPLQRPVVLSVASGLKNGLVEVDNIRLIDDGGRELIANGDFAQGGARWYFYADDHLPWHIFNLGAALLFEMGWLGLLTVAGAALLSMARLSACVWRGDVLAGAVLAALCGFLAIGATESLFDGPRVTTMFFLLLLVGFLRTDSSSGGAAHQNAP